MWPSPFTKLFRLIGQAGAWLKRGPGRAIRIMAHKRHMELHFLVNRHRLKRRRDFIKKATPNRQFILIGQIEYFGDIVACEPVSRYVREKHPDAYIVWAVKKRYRELTDNNPHINETLVVSCMSEWIYLKDAGLFDEIVDLHFEGRFCLNCAVPLKKADGNTGINQENYLHRGCLLTAYCQSAGLPVLDGAPKVYIPQRAVRKVDSLDLPDKFIVIHCAARAGPERNWVVSKWRELAEKILRSWDGAIVEMGLAPVVKLPASSRYIDLCGKISFLTAAEVIRRSQLFVGVDSGPAHLANAVGTFGIILLGHLRSFKRYMPYSGGYANGVNAEMVYQDGPVADISVDRVHSAIEKRLCRTTGSDMGRAGECFCS